MPKLWSVPECARLKAEYEQVRRNYAMAVDHFFAVGYEASDPDYRRLKNSVEEIRSQAQIALAQLEKHRLAVHSGAC
jgi:hypothetical protein